MTQEEKALQALLLDDDWPSCLNEWLGGVNIFDVLKVSRAEIRHSNMLAWLLDPKESHGFGTAFLDGFLKRVCQNFDVGEKTSLTITPSSDVRDNGHIRNVTQYDNSDTVIVEGDIP